MSWHFSRALVEEFSEEKSLGSNALEPLKLKSTPVGFCPRDKTTAHSILSRFGITWKLSAPTILKPPGSSPSLERSQGNSSSVAGSRNCAKTSAPQAKEPDWTEIEAAFGQKCRGLLARFDPATSSWRTAQYSLLGGLEEFSETWPRWGMVVAGESWELTMPALLTSGTGFGLLPTPTAQDAKNATLPQSQRLRDSIPGMLLREMWPTPTVCGNHNRKGASASSGDGLATQVKLFPTPVADGDRCVNYAQGGTSLGYAARNYPTPTASMQTEADMEQARHAGNGGTRPSYQDAKLPTPKASDGERGGRGDLIQAVRGNENSHFKLWPTPHGFSPDGKSNGPSGNELGRAVNREFWPTPQAHDAAKGDPNRVGRFGTKHGGRNLNDEVAAAERDASLTTEEGLEDFIIGRKFPTPRTPSATGGGTGLDGGSGARAMLSDEDRAELCSGSLNSDWVEALMGWPKGWTSLEPLDPAALADWQQGDHWHPAWEDGTPRVLTDQENRVGRLRCIGNGQVPAALVLAWMILNPDPLP